MQTICKKCLHFVISLQKCKKANRVILHLIIYHYFNKIVKHVFFSFFQHFSVKANEKETYFL